MPDQSKKANQLKKNGAGNKGETSQPANGKPSGSSGNSSTQTTSGGGGNAQAASSQPESPAMERYKNQKRKDEPPVLIALPDHEPRLCPEEVSKDFDEKLNEPEGENQPGSKGKGEGKGQGKNIQKW